MKLSIQITIFFFITVFLSSSLLYAQTDPFNSPVILDADTLENQAVAFGDYNDDGWVDLYITRGNSDDGTSYTNLFFTNQSGTFVKETTGDPATVDSTSGGATWGDYNNDGYLDLYVANAQNGASPPFGNATPKQNHLFMGGPGGLTLVTNAGDIIDTVEDSRHVGWGDYDNDGYLDMFVDNGRVGGFGPLKGKNSFYRNNGNGTFTLTDVGNLVLDDNAYKTFGSGFGWADYNNDGYSDIFNAGGGGPINRLWKNNGDGSGFTEVLSSVFQDSNYPTSTLGVSWGDFDNDGDMDLFLANMIDGSNVGYNYLYENLTTASKDSFHIVRGNTDLDTTFDYSQGTVWEDFDNDGDLDLFVANDGNSSLDISRYYVNSGYPDYNLTPIVSIVETLDPGDGTQKGFGRGAAAADVDNDGDIDLVVARYGKPLLYKNKGNSNNYVFIKLTGNGTTNYSAIGAKVYVVANIPEQGGVVKQFREVSGVTGGGGQNDMRQHFGLGTATVIDSVIIKWPASGLTDIYTNVAVNQYLSYSEPTGVNRPPVAVDDDDTTYQDTAVNIDVLANDSDPDGNSLTVDSVGSPSNGTATNNGSDVTYTPNSGFIGTDSFDYVVSDGQGGLDTARVTVQVLEPNQPPSAADDDASTNEDNSVTIDVLANDSDPDGDALTVSDVTQGMHGSVEINIDSTVTYTPNADFFGADSFKYYINDGNGGTDSATVHVDVKPINDPPEIVGLPDVIDLETNQCTGLYMKEYESDIDTPDTLLTWSFSVSDPAITYSFDEQTDSLTICSSDVEGTFYLYATLTDDSSASDQDTIEINVSDPSAITDMMKGIPKTYKVAQNFPNPFNPVTTIVYGLPRAGQVKIDVYNITGQKVMTLEDGFRSAGYHKVTFDAAHLASGLYFYNVQAGKFHKVMKMILMK